MRTARLSIDFKDGLTSLTYRALKHHLPMAMPPVAVCGLPGRWPRIATQPGQTISQASKSQRGNFFRKSLINTQDVDQRKVTSSAWRMARARSETRITTPYEQIGTQNRVPASSLQAFILSGATRFGFCDARSRPGVRRNPGYSGRLLH